MPDEIHEWLSFADPDEDRTWVFDVTFLTSRWSCVFGCGCNGVLTEDSPELVQGCCSYGAHFTSAADLKRVRDAAETLTADQWQFKAKGGKNGRAIAAKDDTGTWITKQVDDACILLNRPDFPGGAGCALHRAALERGEKPLDLKPDVCWQLPLRRVDAVDSNGHIVSTIREWKRRDWGEGGFEFSWWCTESPDAFVGADQVVDTLEDELRALVGDATYERLRDTLAERERATVTFLPHPAVRSARGPVT